MAEIVFLGSAGGVFKTLSTLASRAGYRGSLVATEDAHAFARSVSESKVGLAGPSLFKHELAVAEKLGLHSRVFRALPAAGIPKGNNDLYSTANFSVVVPHGVATIPKDDVSFSTVQSLNVFGERDAGTEALMMEWQEFVKQTAKVVAEVAEYGPYTAVDFPMVSGVAQKVQTSLHAAVQSAVTSAGHGKPQMERSVLVVRTVNHLANRMTLHPERVSTVVLSPLEEMMPILRLAEGLVGGRGLSSYTWAGTEGAIFHTGGFEDGVQANPVGACLALCQLLAEKDAATADRLYNALRTAAKGGDTNTLAAEGKLEAAVSAAL
eukprot:TRINITY_DN3223_c0_g1_i1.p1 TRINITY_DN3223_c0_g1~~TRINITY_DN3223_c0_g1_i1.p1  ORF type:complete len:342 (+),score=79.00 TRINITY_DN3223_c0_g1_i1:62-1027(+)